MCFGSYLDWRQSLNKKCRVFYFFYLYIYIFCFFVGWYCQQHVGESAFNCSGEKKVPFTACKESTKKFAKLLLLDFICFTMNTAERETILSHKEIMTARACLQSRYDANGRDQISVIISWAYFFERVLKNAILFFLLWLRCHIFFCCYSLIIEMLYCCWCWRETSKSESEQFYVIPRYQLMC